MRTFLNHIKNETLDEIKTSLENLWQQMIQLSEFFQYSFVLILKRKCLVGASRVRCGESGTPSTIIYTRWSSRRYELGCDTPVGTTLRASDLRSAPFRNPSISAPPPLPIPPPPPKKKKKKKKNLVECGPDFDWLIFRHFDKIVLQYLLVTMWFYINLGLLWKFCFAFTQAELYHTLSRLIYSNTRPMLVHGEKQLNWVHSLLIYT